MLYETLDQALEEVAERSFYEPCRVCKSGDIYTVEDWRTGVEEYTSWTWEDGPVIPERALDNSRVHEPYEYYHEAAHIRYNLDVAVGAIEAGMAVGFTYVVVDAECDHGDEYCGNDHAVGWMLVATPE